MRVCYSIGVRFAGGGIGNTAYQAVRGLHRHGLELTVLCGSYRRTELPRDRFRALGLTSRILRRAALYDRRRWLTMLHNRLYDRWAASVLPPCDLFHGWGGFCLRSLEASREAGATIVVERASSHPAFQDRLLREEHTRWGLIHAQPRAVLRQAVKELELADYVLIPSDFVRRSFLEAGFAPGRLLQLPFGVDTVRFQPPGSNPPPDRPFRVLFVGQLGLQKGVLYLLAAWERLAWPDAQLWLAGRPQRQLAPLLQRYGQLPGVRMLGHVPEPEQLYPQADVFAFPSLQEGSALVTYEALACGLPVITTPNAGSVIQDGLEGHLVPVRDADSLAGKLEELRSRPELRREMGRASRRLAEKHTWELYGDRLAEALVRSHHGPGLKAG
jgi:glycosyltransferase involved in cell wall biosynthesis